MNSPRIDFYTRKGCHLCKEALEVLRDFQREFDFEIQLIDISGSTDLTQLYDNDIPVATLDGRKILKHRADRNFLRRVLAEASTYRHG